ncbi:unnamed protein product [Brassica rapa]|uniref:Uncharacterized protein n=2 Tax=Brassica TaxID=3705 RepID=A0A3P6AW30_BRACM|nr:unnamed protein product [Brassica napus]CAG7893284.1 unnamed protein product [Brassica rapa]VDC88288.1 unnamed protein product [Brassica rapa]
MMFHCMNYVRYYIVSDKIHRIVKKDEVRQFVHVLQQGQDQDSVTRSACTINVKKEKFEKVGRVRLGVMGEFFMKFSNHCRAFNPKSSTPNGVVV